MILLAVIYGAIYILAPEKIEEPSKASEHPKPESKPTPKKETQTESESKTIMNNSTIDEYLKSINFSGTAVVVREGKFVLNKGYGYSNRDTKQLNTPDTRYYIGSAQKALTAVSILQLSEQGKIQVDDPISRYLSEFPNGSQITIRNLLNHTSGIKGHIETNDVITPLELVQDIERRGIKRGPGKWNYQDSNYTVLSYLVEKLSGETLADFYKRHIFEPAGMNQVGFYSSFKNEKDRSVGYFLKKDGTYSVPSVPDLSQLFGVGNLYMSASDMYRFDQALSSGKLLKQKKFFRNVHGW